jgi:asparagine synthase (glutamine-hydrolysing)
MCGINGIFAYDDRSEAVSREELLRTRDRMTTRGPDGCGEWISDDGRIGLGHRRLSIIDLSEAGAQPMHAADGSLTIAFNGEIYNYRELRQGLEARGRVFRSHSDTEVLLHLYAEKGAEMLRELRGMFAFAIWDDRARELFIARDPYGIKPLYYADDGKTFRFASQVKSLIAGGGVSKALEPAGLVGFYLWGNVPEPWTTTRGVHALPAGSYAMVSAGGMSEPRRFFSLSETYRRAEAAPKVSDGEARERVRAALLDSVRSHLVADVPVGAFLSAGIDSGALVGLMRDAGQSDIQTITLGFAEFENKADDEVSLAAEVARLYGARHTTRVVTEDEFLADLPLILDAMDQPTIDGVNTWFVAKATREAGLKVAVSGVGGDELFGGYPSFTDIPRWTRTLSPLSRLPFAGRAFRALMEGLAGAGVHKGNPKTAALVELGGSFPGAFLLRRGVFMPSELRHVLDPDILDEGLERLDPLGSVERALEPWPATTFARVALLESSLYMRSQLLRDTDWASMAHSLEVRTPLVDSVLLETVAPLGPDRSPHKGLLAQAPSIPLPDAVVNRPKTGFGTPVGTWMERAQGDLAASMADRRSPWARRWAKHVGRRQQA